MRAAFALLLCACTAPDAAPATDTALAVPPLDPPATGPAWSPADVAAAWDTAVATGWPDAGEAIGVYLDLMSKGDAGCPGDALQLDDSVVLGCTADSGYWFSGISAYVSEDTSESGVDAGTRYLHGDLWLATPDGLALRVGGSAYHGWSFGAEERSFTDGFEGTWIWEGADGPLAGGVSALGMTQATRSGAGDTVVVDGAFGFNGLAFEAEDLLVDGDGCATGTLALRDPALGWHTVTFASCDGCGTVVHDTGASGEACFDLGVLRDLPSARLGGA